MGLAKRFLMGTGAVALAALIGTLIAPKAAQAVVSTLVTVANTIANPAITQDTSKTASQLVNLFCDPSGGSARCISLDGGAAFNVPAGQTLVITSVIITNMLGGSGTDTVELSTASFGWFQYYLVPNATTSQFEYPSGIKIAAGYPIWAAASIEHFVYVFGYLTAN